MEEVDTEMKMDMSIVTEMKMDMVMDECAFVCPHERSAQGENVVVVADACSGMILV